MKTTAAANPSLRDRVVRRFVDEFGDGPVRVFFAPGRVNLVGAHLDYNGGDVLPLAVDRGIYVGARLRPDRRIRLRSLNDPLAVETAAEAVGERADPEHGWAAYALGVWREFAVTAGRRAGVDLCYGGDLPMASGLASSAAIGVATAFALDALHGIGLEPVEIAEIAHRAETGYVGLQCGIMDQYASALGRSGHVVLLHCFTKEWEHVPVDPDAFEILVMDTRRPRRLAASRFNERVRECARAHRLLREHVRDLPCLAAYSEEDLEAGAPFLDAVAFRRARHVVTEMRRIARGVAGLRAGNIAALGRALDESHRSAREDYEVSCEELDEITGAARRLDPVFGARLTGAGFGGCAIALVQPGRSPAVEAYVHSRFVERFGVEPGFEVLHPGGGPREVDSS